MIDRSTFWLGGAGGVLLATCCGVPLLASALGTAGIAARLAWSMRILLPAIGLAAVAGALVFYLRFRRSCAPSARGENRSGIEAGSLR